MLLTSRVRFEPRVDERNKNNLRNAQVTESLQGALEQHAGVAKQEQQQWLTAASEKVTWCADVSGDKYRCGHVMRR